jgi:hypothetical protein
MKKIILAILMTVFLSSQAFAAWTTAVSYEAGYTWRDGTQFYVYKITATSDASGSGDITLSTALETTYGTQDGKYYHSLMKGGTLYAVEFVPDASDTPTTQGTITIDTANGVLVFSEQVAVAGTGEMFDGDVDVGILPPLTDIIFACTTLADTKKAVFYIWILK